MMITIIDINNLFNIIKKSLVETAPPPPMFELIDAPCICLTHLSELYSDTRLLQLGLAVVSDNNVP